MNRIEGKNMKLAEALQERADLNRRIAQLRERLCANARVQEGETTAEDPKELLKEADACAKRLEELIVAINRTNGQTTVQGKTLSAWIAARDMLQLRIETYRTLIREASDLAGRMSRSEIRIKSAVDVRSLQKEADVLSKQLRETDNLLQQANWNTELI